MNSAIISQIARPAAISKSMVRTFASSPVRMQFEKAHHQVAPLTDSTLYAPQGHVSASSSASNATATSASANDTTVFTPSVNAVFDD
ncbi:homoserine O- acetyltransferase [Mucor velutinosus]|uniref:Homoserine O- acetyltransferase n=1 Tax=Mucor velutinosus TaxID=708070 RepID=A0AAN7HSI3_9FUNG|nr:homoserine O- acetyltransferase [Mucor velutinosus]